jgi:hypothetical protein
MISFSEKNSSYFTKEIILLKQKSRFLLPVLEIFLPCQPAEKKDQDTEKTVSPEEIPMIHASGATLFEGEKVARSDKDKGWETGLFFCFD